MKESSLTLLPLPADIAAPLAGHWAHIREEMQVIKTYPFSGPDPVAVRAHRRDLRKIYPYFTFDDLAHEGMDQTWNVIRLDNPYIEAFVLPGVGGKLVGALEKSTEKDFIYYNQVLKFRASRDARSVGIRRDPAELWNPGPLAVGPHTGGLSHPQER